MDSQFLSDIGSCFPARAKMQSTLCLYKRHLWISYSVLRPYHAECTGSRLITEVKQHWAGLVLGWVTAWEYPVLQVFLHASNGSRCSLFPLSLSTFVDSQSLSDIGSCFPAQAIMQSTVCLYKRHLWISYSVLRPYHAECTDSRLITEVKQHWAGLVLGWVTAWEYPVL